jgi:pimeloyl-ACP methyl ester carboxylesterase
MCMSVSDEPRQRMIELPGRGGAMAVLEMGPVDRPVDIIFSHANGFNGRTYRTILEPLADHLRVLAVDLRGHGASTLPTVIEGRIGWLEFRDDLLALLGEVADVPVVLAGHSMGGTSSLLAAAAEPGRVKALALFDPVVVPVEAQRQPMMLESVLYQGALRRRASFPGKAEALAAYLGRGGFKTWREAQVADYVEGGFRETETGEVTLTCAPEWEASNFAMHNYDAISAFGQVRCPTRVLRAELGSTFRIEGREAELAANPLIEIMTVPGTTHFLPMERPELVVEVLAASATAQAGL